MWLDCRPWTVSKKIWWLKISTEEKTHRMSKVWSFIWVLSLDYGIEGIWGLSRWGSTLLGHGVSPWVRTKEFVYPVLTPEVFQVGGVECSRCPKIFFNQNLAMFQQSCQKDSIFPDRRAVQKFAFDGHVVPPTVNRSSCFRWRNAMAVGCSQAGGDWWLRTGVGANCANHGDWGRRLKRINLVHYSTAEKELA